MIENRQTDGSAKTANQRQGTPPYGRSASLFSMPNLVERGKDVGGGGGGGQDGVEERRGGGSGTQKSVDWAALRAIKGTRGVVAWGQGKAW